MPRCSGASPGRRTGWSTTRRSLPARDAPSFLAAARAAGRSTASVICWPPMDQLIEAHASQYRVSLDCGYDPHDDDVVTGETIDLLRRYRPDVTLTYLVSTDLAGHAAGWGSDDYLAAAGANRCAARRPDRGRRAGLGDRRDDRSRWRRTRPLRGRRRHPRDVRRSSGRPADRTRIDVVAGVDPRRRPDHRRPRRHRRRSRLDRSVARRR